MSGAAEQEIIRLLRLLPGDEAAEALYRRAVDRLELSRVDYTSVREICRLAGYSNLMVDSLLICMFLVLQEGHAALRLDAASVRRQLTRFLEGDVEARVAEILEAVQSGVLDRLVAEAREATPSTTAATTVTAPAFRPLVRAAAPGREAYLYFQRHHEQVRQVQARLEERLSANPAGATQPAAFDPSAVQAALAEVLVQHPVLRDAQPVVLNPEQKLALHLGLRQNLTLVSGGPGTGKTAICTALLRCFVRLGVPLENLRLAAPTGRAARRMLESLRRDIGSLAAPADTDQALLGLTSSTLHGLLEFEPRRNRFRRHAYHPLQADLLLVDEVSMVDMELMASLLTATPPTCRLILIGDPRQLPPVEAGDVLAGLLPQAHRPTISAGTQAQLQQMPDPPGAAVPVDASEVQRLAALAGAASCGPLTDRVACLVRNYRATPLLNAASEAINAGDAVGAAAWPPVVLDAERIDFKGDGVYRLDTVAPGLPAWPAVVEQWVTAAYFATDAASQPAYFDWVDRLDRFTPEQLATTAWRAQATALFARLESARLLTLVRRGPVGSENLNRFVSGYCKRRRGVARDRVSFPGMPILVLQNNACQELYNGDVGVLLTDADGALQALFPSALDGFRLLPESGLPDYAPAFAMTVHKSQGSEYDRVLLALPGDPTHRMLRRELLYTALTRARRGVWIYGPAAALEAAVQRSEPRDSGLRWW